jgi:hypothetical protein
MNAVDESIKKIDEWLKATGMKEYRLGLLACANNYAVDRIRSGRGSVESLRQILRYIEDNPAEAAKRKAKK